MGRARVILAEAINPHRRRAAEREHERFRNFCERIDLPEGPDAVCLYLAAHDDEGGVQARARVSRLDLAAHLHDEPPPGRDRVVRRFLTGHYRTHPLGPASEVYDPLYTGDVHALIDATLAPTWQQLRDHAFLLTMNASGLRWEEMKRLTWQDVRFAGTAIELKVELRKGKYGPRHETVILRARKSPWLSPTLALRRLHAATPLDPSRPVFSTRGGNLKSARLRTIVSAIHEQRKGPQRLGQAVLTDTQVRSASRSLLAVLPIAHRDRLLILLGFLAGLSNAEAQRLRVGHIRQTSNGLLLTLDDRRHSPIAVHARPGSPYCPATAWNAWHRILKSQNRAAPSDPVFVGCDPYLPVLGSEPLRVDSITETLNVRVAQAGLIGKYCYLSLKDGFIRSALRLDVPHHEIALHVGHKTLVGIIRRDLDETAMSRNILPLLGL